MGKKVIQILLFIFLFTNLFADETDNFTYSKVSQKDSYEVINEKFNYYLQKGIDDANSKGKGNNKKVLYKAINKYITDRNFKDSITLDIYADKNIDLINVKKEDSIYYNWNLVNGMSLGKKGTFMAGVINFNGIQIGIDKLEHMFRTGEILFRLMDKGYKMEEDFETIIEGFIDKIHTDFGLRLDIKNIFWRGFCSQGDGLCFDFKLGDKEAFEFLLKLKCENIEHLKDAVNISDVGIEIETVKNNFATHYCHSNTRDINVDIYIKNDADIKNKSLFDLLSNPESFKNLQDEIRVWYVDRCQEMYHELEKHYNEVQDLESEQEDLTFSERVDELVDPEMDIDKVINLIQDATSLNYTKGEAYNLIEKFRESFKNDYMIIRKIN